MPRHLAMHWNRVYIIRIMKKRGPVKKKLTTLSSQQTGRAQGSDPGPGGAISVQLRPTLSTSVGRGVGSPRRPARSWTLGLAAYRRVGVNSGVSA